LRNLLSTIHYGRHCAFSICCMHPNGLMIRFSSVSESCWFVYVRRPLWREDRSAVCNCCCASPGQSFPGPSPAGLVTIYYCQKAPILFFHCLKHHRCSDCLATAVVLLLVQWSFHSNGLICHNMMRQRTFLLIYVETSVRNKCRCSFYCALLTLYVSAPIGGHLQVVCNSKNSKAVTVYHLKMATNMGWNM
jgi:hypothetical protein